MNCSNSTNSLLNSREPSTRSYITVATRSVLMRKECQCDHGPLSSSSVHNKHRQIGQSKDLFSPYLSKNGGAATARLPTSNFFAFQLECNADKIRHTAEVPGIHQELLYPLLTFVFWFKLFSKYANILGQSRTAITNSSQTLTKQGNLFSYISCNSSPSWPPIISEFYWQSSF